MGEAEVPTLKAPNPSSHESTRPCGGRGFQDALEPTHWPLPQPRAGIRDGVKGLEGAGLPVAQYGGLDEAHRFQQERGRAKKMERVRDLEMGREQRVSNGGERPDVKTVGEREREIHQDRDAPTNPNIDLEEDRQKANRETNRQRRRGGKEGGGEGQDKLKGDSERKPETDAGERGKDRSRSTVCLSGRADGRKGEEEGSAGEGTASREPAEVGTPSPAAPTLHIWLLIS